MTLVTAVIEEVKAEYYWVGLATSHFLRKLK